MAEVKTQIVQISETASEGIARNHSVFIDRPETKGGADKGPMGGELFLVGLGGCFMSNLLAAIQSRDEKISGVKVDISGTLDENPLRFSAVHLSVSADYPDRDQMVKLVTIAERGCIVANTVKDAVQLTFDVV